MQVFEQCFAILGALWLKVLVRYHLCLSLLGIVVNIIRNSHNAVMCYAAAAVVLATKQTPTYRQHEEHHQH
jgi:hypothetical protein